MLHELGPKTQHGNLNFICSQWKPNAVWGVKISHSEHLWYLIYSRATWGRFWTIGMSLWATFQKYISIYKQATSHLNAFSFSVPLSTKRKHSFFMKFVAWQTFGWLNLFATLKNSQCSSFCNSYFHHFSELFQIILQTSAFYQLCWKANPCLMITAWILKAWKCLSVSVACLD